MNNQTKPVLGIYTQKDNEEALALDQKCVQGDSFRMSFNRSTFHRRAENFSDWNIFTARVGGQLAGTVGAAVKDVVLFGSSQKATFFFDLRVDPEYRERGIGNLLTKKALQWSQERTSLIYTYALAENRLLSHMAKQFGGIDAGGYSYLVCPVYREKSTNHSISTTSFEEVHQAMLEASPGFDFYSYPDIKNGKSGWVDSWMIRNGTDIAGCSAWNNRGILGEVIESVPLPFKIAKSLLETWPLNRFPVPRIPAEGEELHSWYLFDFFATDPLLARDLMRHVSKAALNHGIDYCYIPHNPGQKWIKAVRSDFPRMFSPIIPYRLLIRYKTASKQVKINRVYVDIRDL